MGAKPAGSGRFSDAGLLILLSLADGDKHGYAMLMDIKSSLGVTLGIGTLYQAVDRMVNQGLIEPLPSSDRRRPYRLTALGEAELRRQLDMMHRLTTLGQHRLAGI